MKLQTDENGVLWKITRGPRGVTKRVKVNDPNFKQDRVDVPRWITFVTFLSVLILLSLVLLLIILAVT